MNAFPIALECFPCWSSPGEGGGRGENIPPRLRGSRGDVTNNHPWLKKKKSQNGHHLEMLARRYSHLRGQKGPLV